MTSEIIRKLHGYEKHGDRLLVVIELPPLELAFLQELFDLDVNNPMYDAYDIEAHHKEVLEPIVRQPIDIDKYDFFLE